MYWNCGVVVSGGIGVGLGGNVVYWRNGGDWS